MLTSAQPRVTQFTGSSKVAEILVEALDGKVKQIIACTLSVLRTCHRKQKKRQDTQGGDSEDILQRQESHHPHEGRCNQAKAQTHSNKCSDGPAHWLSFVLYAPANALIYCWWWWSTCMQARKGIIFDLCGAPSIHLSINLSISQSIHAYHFQT